MSRLAWTAYLLMACEGFLIYAVGFITPFVRHDLDLPAWLAAMPNSALALGLAGAGVMSAAVNDRVGPRVAIRLWAWLMAASALLLATPLTILPVLIGALLFGASAGGTLVHVNSALGVGRRGGSALVRANLWSVGGGLIAPLVLSAAATTVDWRIGVLAPVPVLVLLALMLPASPARDRPVTSSRGTTAAGARSEALPGNYWRAWLFLTLAIGAEFSFVVWGSQVVAARVGIDDAAATGLASLYVAGMIVGRLLLAAGPGAQWRWTVVLRRATALAVLGALTVAVATGPELAGLGMLLGGLGIAPAYPLGASLALAHAPQAPVRASQRLTAASGVAIFAVPLGLGILVGVAGILGAWLAVLVMLGAALLVIVRVPVAPSQADVRTPSATPAA